MACLRTDLKGVFHLGNTTLMNELESNLKVWLDWGFLRIHGWFDVDRPSTPGAYGGDFAVLRNVEDPSYTDGQVWEAARKDWVWETGVDYVGVDTNTYNPIVIPADVTVNGISTNYDWIDYPLGRVYFSSPISITAIVLAEYSYRWVQIYKATNCGWWKELQYRSFRVDDSHFLQDNTGAWSIGGQHRIQMPTIIIEAVPRSTSRPYEIGNGSYWVKQDVLCHIFAENGSDRNKLVDILRGQFDASIWLFNSNEISAAEAWPLDHRGMLVDSSKTYPALVDTNGYRWIKCRFANTSTFDTEILNSRLYQGVVRLTCEVVLPD